MALDPRILLQSTTPNLIQALQSGIQAGTAIRQAPLIEALQRQKLASAQQQAQAQQIAQAEAQRVQGIQAETQKGQFVNRLAKQLRSAPLDQRADIVNQNVNTLQAFGVDPNRLTDLSDQSLDNAITATNAFATPVDPRLALQERTLDVREAELAQRKELAFAKPSLSAETESLKSDVKIQKGAEIEDVKAIGQDRNKIRVNFRDQASAARKTISNARNLKKGLSELKSGRLASARQSLGKIIPGLRDAAAEDFVSQVNAFVLGQKDDLLGGGILSDADIALLQSTGPQLGATVEGNMRILSRIIEGAEQALDESRDFSEFTRGGGNPEDFQFDRIDVFDGFGQQPSQPQQQPSTQQGQTFTTSSGIQFKVK